MSPESQVKQGEKRKRDDAEENTGEPMLLSNFSETIIVVCQEGRELSVHKDVLIKGSSHLRQLVRSAGAGSKIKLHLGYINMSRYVHFLYTASIPDSPVASWSQLVHDYNLGCCLRDIHYTNAIMDKFMDITEPDCLVDIVAWLTEVRWDIGCNTKHKCFWQWLVDAVAFKLSTEKLSQASWQEEWPAKFVRALLAKVVARMEKPEEHEPPTLANKERYYVHANEFGDVASA